MQLSKLWPASTESTLDVLRLLEQAIRTAHPSVQVGWVSVHKPDIGITVLTVYIDGASAP